MGWNTWNRFHCDVSEDLVKQAAEAMVATGMRDAGYQYVVIDDCWQVSRDETGQIVADPDRFPSGIAALADYVHSLGLKFGIYTCAGTKTCQGRPGSYGFEEKDMRTYASWGVDFVKVDWCYTTGMDPRERYKVFRDAIKAAGRPMVFSICNWGVGEPWVWGPITGQMWRTSMDIWDGFLSVLFNLSLTAPWAAFAGPGHWNDPDMLEVGNGGMTADEYRAHMGLWAMLAAPLIAGNDLRNMSEETLAILTNPEVIAVDQDPLGLQAVLLEGADTGRQVYARPLAGPGLRAVALFNALDEEAEIRVDFHKLGLAEGPVRVRDLWRREDLGDFEGSFASLVAGHSIALLRLQGREATPPSGTSYLSDLPWMYAANTVGPVERDRANGGPEAGDGGPIRVAGKSYPKGLGVSAASKVAYYIGGRCSRFKAIAGLDDTAGPSASVRFEVIAGGQKVFDSGRLVRGSAPVEVDVSISGAQVLLLHVSAEYDSAEGDIADWADARLVCD